MLSFYKTFKARDLISRRIVYQNPVPPPKGPKLPANTDTTLADLYVGGLGLLRNLLAEQVVLPELEALVLLGEFPGERDGGMEDWRTIALFLKNNLHPRCMYDFAEIYKW